MLFVDLDNTSNIVQWGLGKQKSIFTVRYILHMFHPTDCQSSCDYRLHDGEENVNQDGLQECARGWIGSHCW